LAFGVGMLGGCATATEPTVESTESSVNGAGESAAASEAPCDKDQDAAPPALECKAVIEKGFEDHRTFSLSAETAPADLKQCCSDALLGNLEGPHPTFMQLYECCQVVDWSIFEGDVPTACTPWGPPVPPAMPVAPGSAAAANNALGVA